VSGQEDQRQEEIPAVTVRAGLAAATGSVSEPDAAPDDTEDED
jgi:hypothetical protein